ncbi:MAG: cysteine desulfurase family protein [Pseudomonadota bacterium]
MSSQRDRGRVYLDHNATAPLRPEARDAMLAALDLVGNPSSIHADGRAARDCVETARERVARLVGAMPSEVVFTSGATEANNWVLTSGWDRILISDIEHESVLIPGRRSTAEIITLPVLTSGEVDVGRVADHVLCGPCVGRDLVTLQYANNETGIVQDVAAVAGFCRAHDVAVHTDAVQAAGRLPLQFDALNVDFMSISAHKLGGPKGIGALIIRDGVTIPSAISGGGQERSRRSGTENVAAIAGFGAAAAAALRDVSHISALQQMRDAFEAELKAIKPEAVIIGEDTLRLANTSCLAVPGLRSETLVIKCDLAGFSVSAGAACSSGKASRSHVLMAMGLDDNVVNGAVRISLGWTTSKADLESFLKRWRELSGGATPLGQTVRMETSSHRRAFA